MALPNLEPAFVLEGSISLQVRHEIEGDALKIYFDGGGMGRYDATFEQYVGYTEALSSQANSEAIRRIECHLENFGEALSRTQHTVYRMLNMIRPHVEQIAIVASDTAPEHAEHLRMSQLFVDGMQGKGGAALTLVKV